MREVNNTSGFFFLLPLLHNITEEYTPRRVAKVLIGVFVEPQILLSAGGALTGGSGVMLPRKVLKI